MSAVARAPGIDWSRVLKAACHRIEADAPDLTTLAREVGVSRAELQRQFTRRLGVSPKAYAQTLSLHRLAQGVPDTRNALDAVLEAGFESPSTGYAAAARALGAPPGRLRGELQIGWWMGLSDLGWMLMGATGRGICWLAFGAEPGRLLGELRAAYPRAQLVHEEARLYAWFEQVRDFVLLPREALDLPVDIQGTAFQGRVWRALRRIPLGATVSYGRLARGLDAPQASRAVAAACAANRVALLIPCHRAIGGDGGLRGYRWGVQRKRALLERERPARGAAAQPAESARETQAPPAGAAAGPPTASRT